MNAKNTKLDQLTHLYQEVTSELVKENLWQCVADKNKSGNKSNQSWTNTAEVSNSMEDQERDNIQKW